MYQEVKVRKIGSSHGIILSKEILEQLGVKEGDSLHLKKDPDGGLKIEQYDSDFDHQMKVALEVMDRYKDTLKELADR